MSKGVKVMSSTVPNSFVVYIEERRRNSDIVYLRMYVFYDYDNSRFQIIARNNHRNYQFFCDENEQESLVSYIRLLFDGKSTGKKIEYHVDLLNVSDLPVDCSKITFQSLRDKHDSAIPISQYSTKSLDDYDWLYSIIDSARVLY